MLYRSTDRLCRCGAPMQNLAHSASFESLDKDAPSKAETKHLVFLPTTSPSPDFYGGLRPGDNRRADSVIALKAETGAMVWSYQLVHHDVWDYDIPAQPSLATISLDGKERDVVIQGTKQGLVLVLDRDTGQPVLPVAERPVPQGGVP